MNFFKVLGVLFIACLFDHVFSRECSAEQEGLSVRWECNRCKCRRGIWFCTKKGCKVKISKREPSIAVDLKNIPCAPNDFFRIDCNTCYCNLEQSGYLCTEDTCPAVEIKFGGPTTQIPLANNSILLIANRTAQIVQNISDIEDNSTFNLPVIDVTKLRDLTGKHPKIFRNTTKTTTTTVIPNVDISNVTEANNSTNPGNLFSCTPGQVFKKECNDCTCTQDGKNAICTTHNCTTSLELLGIITPVILSSTTPLSVEAAVTPTSEASSPAQAQLRSSDSSSTLLSSSTTILPHISNYSFVLSSSTEIPSIDHSSAANIDPTQG